MLKHVLIVDDSLTARHNIIRSLPQDARICVHEAANGKKALEMLKQLKTVDLIFTDMNMPWMGGLEFLHEINAHKLWCHIPTCVVSTDNGQACMKQARSLGAIAYLIKPIRAEQVQMLINRYLIS
jgi:two-component system, chemotaxis family, chemotaxis protein CheY